MIKNHIQIISEIYKYFNIKLLTSKYFFLQDLIIKTYLKEVSYLFLIQIYIRKIRSSIIKNILFPHLKRMTNTPELQQPHLHRLNPFGKYQKTFALIVMIFAYQCPLIISIFALIYSFIYLDHNIWIAFIIISIIQYPIGRCQMYINFVNNYINPLLYFKSFTRIFEEPIPIDQNKCMFSFHPHGVFAYGLLANMNYYKDDALSRMVGLSSRFMLNMPITGLLLRLWGVDAVDPNNLKRLMSKERNIGLLPGGFEQATLTTAKQFRIYVQSRKGFIKYALRYNYTIYPTIILNQHQAFWTFDYWLKFRMLVNRIKMPGVIFFNPKSLWFYPSTVQFITVVGKGIKGRQYKDNEQPTNQQIDEVHKEYIKQLKRIYDKHKQKNGNKPLVMY